MPLAQDRAKSALRTVCAKQARNMCAHMERGVRANTEASTYSRSLLMIDHTGLVVSNYERSKRFYQAALEPIGYALLHEFPKSVTGTADRSEEHTSELQSQSNL